MWLLGIVGKPNVGKSTFFAAATLAPVRIANFPFTTIEPNKGVAYVRVPCVCRELGVKDDPVNSRCIEGNRFIPVEIVDCAGLVPDAWRGRGLGNQFLSEISKAQSLIHVVDASGSTDIEGRPCQPRSHDPLEDVKFLERELAMWFYQILTRDWRKTARRTTVMREKAVDVLSERLSGLVVKREHVARALEKLGLPENLEAWSEEDIAAF